MKYITIPLFLIIFIGCATWKKTLRSDGNYNGAISNVITDFVNSRLIRSDSIFNIHIMELNDQYIISIKGVDNPIFSRTEYKIGSYGNEIFPTQYDVRNHKLFLWNDPKTKISNKIISVLKQYNHIDTLWQNEWIIPPHTINDSPIGYVYYVCKTDLTHYKRIAIDRLDKRHKTLKLYYEH